MVIRKLSFKSGILIGLALYALGALLTIPASLYRSFDVFLIGFYILTFGLAFLETSANPYILSMGPPETATRRLNLAQAFNPIGSLTGMMVASFFVLPNLQVATFRAETKAAHPEFQTLLPSEVDGRITEIMEKFAVDQPAAHQLQVSHDLEVVRLPYLVLGLVVLAVFVVFLLSKMPDTGREEDEIHLSTLLRRLINFPYLGGGLPARISGIVCPHWRLGLHGVNVSHHLWHCPQRTNPQRCQTRLGRADLRDRWRSFHASHARRSH